MSYRQATVSDIDKNITQFFTDKQGTRATERPTLANIADYYVLSTSGDNYHMSKSDKGGSRRARRPSRKYKKSAKRVFRKKSRSTRRRWKTWLNWFSILEK